MREVSPESPEERRKHPHSLARAYVGPGSRFFEVSKRTLIGVYNDGFIHAGNLAYLTLLTLFPFFIVLAAAAQLIGRPQENMAAIGTVLTALPPSVAKLISGSAQEVLTARTGGLLWFGALVGLWTVSSFIETIRDILRRAYGTSFSRPFWHYRLLGIAIVFGSVAMLMLSFTAQILLTAAQEFIVRFFPAANTLTVMLASSRIIPLAAMFFAIFALFWVLTPARYRHSKCPKWPGALFTTIWWSSALLLLPRILEGLGGYALTYGGFAGVIVALLFFWVVGYGLVIGAHLNAALADSGENALKGDTD